MSTKKRLLVLSIVLCLVLSFAACTGTTAPPTPTPAPPAGGGATTPAEPPAEEEWVWERRVEFIMNFGPGSGTDNTMRAFAPHLERELGVPISIQNVEGASGVRGAEFFHQQPADGYTFSMYTPSHTIAGVFGTTTFDIINETEPVAVLVHAVKLILAGPNTPFDTFEELIEMAREYPGRFRIAVMSTTGMDAVALAELFGMAGVDIPLVGYGSRSEANAAVIGGHIDMVLGDPIDAQFVDSGDMKGIVVMSDRRLPTQPDIPTTVELGFDATMGPWRAIVARRGTPEAALDAMSDAIERANAAPEWRQWLADNDLDAREGFRPRAEFVPFWHSEYVTFRTVMEELGMI